MKTGSIPVSWTSIVNSMSAVVILNLLAEVNRRGIAHDDLVAVGVVWNEMQEDAANALKAEKDSSEARTLEAKVASDKIKNIKSQFPALQWRK